MTNYNIILIGITGVGKTTVGKALAEHLAKEFIDLDKSIEVRCGVDIPTIFAIEGESGFRERETQELRRVLNESTDFVLSIGGGCIIRPENRKMISSGANVVVQLYADIDTLVERLSKSATKRPLLNNVDIATKVTELYESRREYYEKVTDLKVNTSSMKPSYVIEEIVDYLKKKKIS